MGYRRALFFLASAFIFVLSIIPDMSLPEITKWSDAANHFLAFLVLSMLIDPAFPERSFLWKFIFLGGYGFFIEIAQSVSPYRHFSLGDLAVDIAAVLFYFFIRKGCNLWKKPAAPVGQ